MTARPTGPARLTPAQERALREIAEGGDTGICWFITGNRRIRELLADRGLIARCAGRDPGSVLPMQFWRITPAGRAWLAARERGDGVEK